MNWLREAINDSTTGKASSKRVVMLLGGMSMSVSVVVLSFAALLGHPVSSELFAVAGPLAAMAGASYVGGKMAEKGNVPAS